MNRNRWHTALLATGMLLMPVLAGVGLRPAAVAADSSYTYDFEQSVKPWQAGANSYLTRSTGDNLCPLELGTGMAQLSTPLIGADTNIQISMVAGLPAPAGSTLVVDWGAKQVLGGAMLQPNVYTGASANPGADAWRSVKGSRGAYGWTLYHYAAAVPPGLAPGAQVYIGLGAGLSTPGTTLNYFGAAIGIDCVRVRFVSAANQ